MVFGKLYIESDSLGAEIKLISKLRYIAKLHVGDTDVSLYFTTDNSRYNTLMAVEVKKCALSL